MISEKIRDLSIKRKLQLFFLVFIIFCSALFTSVMLAREIQIGSIGLLSCEMRWVGAMKDSFYFAEKYVMTLEDGYYEDYQESIKAIYGSDEVRNGVMEDPPNKTRAYEGYIMGKYPEESFDSIFFALRFLKHSSQMRNALVRWEHAGNRIVNLTSHVDSMHSLDPSDKNLEAEKEHALGIIQELRIGVVPFYEGFFDYIDSAIGLVQTVVFLILLGIFITMGVLFFTIYHANERIIVSSINKLKAATETISKGRFGKTVKGLPRDEIGNLGDSFNRMSRDLKDLYHTIKLKNKSLEKATQDIKQKAASLSKFNKLAVDRELKMIKLKQELAELKEKRQKQKP